MRRIRVIPETRHPLFKRLGRHVEHDSRSRAFAVTAPRVPLVSTKWARVGPIFDQGDIGSCTCEAMCGVLNTAPFYQGVLRSQQDCVSLYQDATVLDDIPGQFPPDDTGSSGLAAARAAANRGWLRSYHHAFSLLDALGALVHGPAMLGINWYESFDEPAGDHGELVIGGELRGGHEIEVCEIDVLTKTVRGINSWGPDWGDGGYWSMGWATLERLLAEQGDFLVPLL